ncbi:MAG TPA: hypothetical protein VG937_16415 [Polyangiaceae bacterium]|nr:hypothetical protein [Polyangiaceae bacterium]
MKPRYSLAIAGLSFVFATAVQAPARAQSAEPPPTATSPDSSADAPAPAAAPAPAPAPEAPPPAEAPPPEPTSAEAPPAPPADKPKPPPYSLPFQLRPVAPGNVIRSDTSLGLYKNPTTGDSGNAVASLLLASYKVTDSFAPLVRVGIVHNSPPSGPSATNFLNPVLGGIYGFKLSPEWKLGLFLGVTVPIGSGGGNDAKPEKKAANAAGIPTRAAMDNAMFAVNDFTVFPGVDLAYVAHGFTAQVEATLLQLTRVKGDAPAVPDSSRTNFTAGLHVGYFLIPQLSLGAELRHQRWLSTPKAVEANDSLRDTTTVAFGPRVHVKLSPTMWLRPGVSFGLPLDDPMKASKYKLLQLDIPFIF